MQKEMKKRIKELLKQGMPIHLAWKQAKSEFRQQPKPIIPEKSIEESLKAYCFSCKTKQTVINPVLTREETKKESYRSFLTGNCSKCQRQIRTLVKNSFHI